MKGTAKYLGESVIFVEAVLNPWRNELDFLVSYDGGRWVRQSDLDSIVYYIDTPLPKSK